MCIFIEDLKAKIMNVFHIFYFYSISIFFPAVMQSNSLAVSTNTL